MESHAGLLCLASLTERHVFKAHPRCSECQSLTPFHGRVIFHVWVDYLEVCFDEFFDFDEV